MRTAFGRAWWLAGIGWLSSLGWSACGDDPASRIPRVAEDLAWADLGFAYATICDVGQDAIGTPAIALVDAFPTAPDFAQPIGLTHAGDGSGRVFILERTGRVRVFHPSDPTAVTTFFDVHEAVTTEGECGLLGFAFDPAFTVSGNVYASYNINDGGQLKSVLSRWHVADPAVGVVDSTSEVVLLTVDQPFSNHKGGDIHFGPDGMLYLGFGDGGSGDDPHANGQNLDTLLAKMLRLDVTCQGCSDHYAIPADNPFAAGGPRAGEGRPEIWAWGLRNPWRWSFDRATGAQWVGDVGQDHWEEVDLVEGGKNYGWRTMEGTHCRPGGDPAECDTSGLTLPLFDYGRNVGNSITGGYVYRGARWPALVGTYLFADYGSGVYFAWNREREPPPTTSMGRTPTAIAGLGEDEAGEVYFLGIGTGRIYGVEVSASVTPTADPPTKLSATGCFVHQAFPEATGGDGASGAGGDGVSGLGTPAEGVLPYELVLPFWSDGALKRRFVVLPEGGKVAWDADGRWSFPVGTVFIKHFDLPTATGSLPWETRFLIRDLNGVRGYTYRWDADGRDATLLSDSLATPWTNAAGASAEWLYPSRTQCGTCHTPTAGGVLGLEASQLARSAHYPWVLEDVPVAQLWAWRAFGLFAPEVPSAATLAAVTPFPALDDEAQPVALRARAWLHENCSNCHLPGGTSGTAVDFRAGIALADMHICDAAPTRGDLGIADARIMAPGAPDRSVLLSRIAHRGADVPGGTGPGSAASGQMPPLGSARVDEAAVAIVTRWIAGLSSCAEVP